MNTEYSLFSYSVPVPMTKQWLPFVKNITALFAWIKLFLCLFANHVCVCMMFFFGNMKFRLCTRMGHLVHKQTTLIKISSSNKLLVFSYVFWFFSSHFVRNLIAANKSFGFVCDQLFRQQATNLRAIAPVNLWQNASLSTDSRSFPSSHINLDQWLRWTFYSE